MHSFEELGVPAGIATALTSQGIITPNAVQVEAIPALMSGQDAVIHAPTGSGKTLGFLLPLVHRLGDRKGTGVRGLIVAPTRELASQIDGVLHGLNGTLRTALLFGGVPYGGQMRALRSSPAVVIGCPGRVIDLARQRAVDFQQVEFLVLDEADEMLDQGFARDVERIISMTPSARQTVLASATMPDWVQSMISKHLSHPTTITVTATLEPDLEHGLLAVGKMHKVEILNRLLAAESGRTIVFHKTKHGAKKLTRDLTKLGHFAAELQGNLSQNARDRAIASFRRGDTHVLVATNVAARGIDVSEVGLVVNYELPDTAEWLTHRVGRTARNGTKGRALTFVSEEDGAQWSKLRRLGAPNLRHVDFQKLLDSGEWVYLAPAPDVRHRPSRTYRVSPGQELSRQGPRNAQGSGTNGSRRPRRSSDRPYSHRPNRPEGLSR